MLIGGTLAAIVVVMTALLVPRYVNDLRERRQRVASLPTELAPACHGMQFMRRGDGEPILVVHGIWGGLDQGSTNVGGVLNRGQYAGVFVSRFGYLGSALPEGASPELQADAFDCLLQELGIPRAAVVAHSAGSTSALQLALRHPERVAALVLVSPNAPGAVDVGLPPRWLARILFRSDFLFWALTKYGTRMLFGLMGVPKGYEIPPLDRPMVDALAATILPVSSRYRGALFDMYESNPAVQDYPLEQVLAPTLVVAAKDDPLALFANSGRMAERIPGAELLAVESGGHMLLGNQDLVDERIHAFLGAPKRSQ